MRRAQRGDSCSHRRRRRRRQASEVASPGCAGSVDAAGGRYAAATRLRARGHRPSRDARSRACRRTDELRDRTRSRGARVNGERVAPRDCFPKSPLELTKDVKTRRLADTWHDPTIRAAPGAASESHLELVPALRDFHRRCQRSDQRIVESYSVLQNSQWTYMAGVWTYEDASFGPHARETGSTPSCLPQGCGFPGERWKVVPG